MMKFKNVGEVIRWATKNDKEVDFYSDYTDDYGYPTWCGAYLTPEGKERFAKVLALPVGEYSTQYNECEVKISDCEWDPDEMEARLYKFLSMAAGYCSVDAYSKYFTMTDPNKVAIYRDIDKRLKSGNETKMNESHEWGEFTNKFPNSDTYLPTRGEGESMGTQACVALCKLVYKWFNDGDVYDNSYALKGWANDISGSANWLYNHIPETRGILEGIEDVEDEDEYVDLLFDLCETVDPMIPELLDKPMVGNAYDEKGPFKFKEYMECDRCGELFDPDSREWKEGDNGMCRDCAEEEEKENEEQD